MLALMETLKPMGSREWDPWDPLISQLEASPDLKTFFASFDLPQALPEQEQQTF
jgi:hypothetical protein